MLQPPYLSTLILISSGFHFALLYPSAANVKQTFPIAVG